MEILRQPLEDGTITISRAVGSCTYPSSFMLVCAMNPCKCGYFGDPSGRCTCTDQSVRGYRKRISGPLLDRIDLHISVPAVSYESLRDRHPAESSEAVRERVNAARRIQQVRYAGKGIYSNAQLQPGMMAEMCPVTKSAQMLLEQAFSKLGLSARSYDRILKVARTIADLEGAHQIDQAHVAEAIQYRTLDRDALL